MMGADSPLLLYICGSGHSGSTLLDLVLGGHGKVTALGEAHRIYLSANNTGKVHDCGCGEPFWSCEFWQEVSAEVARMLRSGDPQILRRLPTTDPRNIRYGQDGRYLVQTPKRRLLGERVAHAAMTLGQPALWSAASTIFRGARMYRTAALNSLMIYEAIRRLRGTPIVVDSTKNAGRLKALYLESSTPMKLLYLLRDGRAVTYSRMRREKVSMEEAAHIWVREHRKQALAHRSVPARDIIRLRYEDFCANPQQALEGLCSALGIDFEPAMLAFRGEGRHSLGGNPMRFDSDHSRISLDEKWRNGLTDTDERVFAKIGGDLNRSFGYI